MTAPTQPALPGPYGIAPDGYRLPGSTHISTVRLQVADLARSVEWYSRVLGFAVIESGNGKASLGAPGSAHPLVELVEHPGASPPPRRGRLGLFHFAILLPDRAALGRFLARQVALDTPIGASDHLVSEALYLSDPDGLGIEVYRDRDRTTWERHGNELAMATLPLDGDGIVAAAGGKPWDGMPPGTSIGHMHLHVGDLEAASRFYHAALGLDLMVWSYPGARFLGAGGYHHHLGINTWAGPSATPPREEDARLLEWELVVPSANDVAALGRSLTGAGFTAENDDRGLLVRDPWGTALRVSRAS
jgi:catechol 2,3-dioxygenase